MKWVVDIIDDRRSGVAHVFQAGYHPTLNTYFSGTKIDSKFAFLHAFFLICPSRPFQILSQWSKTRLFPQKFCTFCTPKRRTHVHCLVLKNNPNYVNFFTRMISNFKYKCLPRAEDVELYNSEYGGGVTGCKTMCRPTPESAPLPLYYQFYFGNENAFIFSTMNQIW